MPCSERGPVVRSLGSCITVINKDPNWLKYTVPNLNIFVFSQSFELSFTARIYFFLILISHYFHYIVVSKKKRWLRDGTINVNIIVIIIMNISSIYKNLIIEYAIRRNSFNRVKVIKNNYSQCCEPNVFQDGYLLCFTHSCTVLV